MSLVYSSKLQDVAVLEQFPECRVLMSTVFEHFTPQKAHFKALAGQGISCFNLGETCTCSIALTVACTCASNLIEPARVQVTTESRMVERSLQFEQAISGGDRATLASFCEAQAQQGGPQDQETWRFLRVNFEEDARR